MSGILSKSTFNKLFILSHVPLFKAWRLYNIQKVAIGSLAFSRYLFEGFKAVYSNCTKVSFKDSLPDLYSKAKGWSGLIKRLIEFILIVIAVPIILVVGWVLIYLDGDELL